MSHGNSEGSSLRDDIETEKSAVSTTQGGQTYYFCSPMCKTKFTQNPAKYALESDRSEGSDL